jgi:hypothetical protein
VNDIDDKLGVNDIDDKPPTDRISRAIGSSPAQRPTSPTTTR